MTAADHSETEAHGSRLNPEALLADLQPVLKILEDDLRERCEQPGEMHNWVYGQWQKSLNANRSAATESAYLEGLITQGAVAWVLGTVFVRWCEDNELIDPHLSGHGERREQAEDAQVRYFRDPEHRLHTHADWIKEGFATLAASDAGRLLFNQQHNPVYRLTPSETAARHLVEFWRTRTADSRHLVHDFRDDGDTWDTRFLGDLYQNLSEKARGKYALLQTPVFVEEFILDHTFTPAIREFGIEGLRTIDPACGSGHFLLGIFHRLLNAWEEHAPARSHSDIARLALDSVHGVDLNPFAVAISRFRLLLATWKYIGVTRLSEVRNQNWSMAVAIGDSLLAGKRGSFEGMDLDIGLQLDNEDVHEFDTLLDVGSYHAVVGNPPYITVKDKALNSAYRKDALYKDVCSGKYPLTVPFAKRFFDLAREAEDGYGAGFTGQITSNSFMKREFGAKLIEKYLPKVNLTHVIDTSGAYIPGHGTPTVILFGRPGEALNDSIRSVLGIRGEPATPATPSKGLVWQAITQQLDHPGSESAWVSVADIPRDRFAKHPWSLSGGGADGLLAALNKNARLDKQIESVGITSFTLEDDVYITNKENLKRKVIETRRPVLLGDRIRDWSQLPTPYSVFPYDEDYSPIKIDEHKATLRHLWPARTILSNNKMFGGSTKIDSGLTWYEFGRLTRSKLRTPLTIAFAEVATHNHFVLDRGGKVFKQTAPVIKLPEGAGEETHLALLGVLNSSTACFWLKQACQDKPSNGIKRGLESDKWTVRFQFNGTNVADLPLPDSFPGTAAQRLDAYANELSSLAPPELAIQIVPTKDHFGKARQKYDKLHERLIAEQEELDWDVYYRYGLLNDEEAAAVLIDDPASVPGIALGERAFEIVLARKMAVGEVETQWFVRHGSTPITEIPAHWPEFYRKVVEARIELIERRRDLALIERPECKRRWNTESWESQERRALRSWLLDRLEDPDLWYAEDSQGYVQPVTRSVLELTDLLRNDEDFTSVASLWAGHVFSDPETRLRDIMAALANEEHVPFLAAYRYKSAGLRLRADWERVWELQRQEDVIAEKMGKEVTHPEVRAKVKEKLGNIPVPDKYESSYFAKGSYWRHRGKLDVPKERFLSYPAASGDNDGSLLLGWAGWDHREQAQSLATLINERVTEQGWEFERLIPLLAGLREVLPWVKQWHPDVDPDFNEAPYDIYRGFLDAQLAGHLTDGELAEWVPTGQVNTAALPKKPRATK